MDPERWPPLVREFVDRLGTKHEGLTIEVDYVEPIWGIIAGCPSCGTKVFWSIVGPAPLAVTPSIPEPAWYAKLNDLPPGGTQ